MKCEVSLALVEEFFDGELDAAEATSVSAHLARCAACREIFEALEFENEAILGAYSIPEPSRSFWHNVEARIASEKATESNLAGNTKSGRRNWFSAGWLSPALAPALGLLVVSLAFGPFLLRKFSSGKSPVKSVSGGTNGTNAVAVAQNSPTPTGQEVADPGQAIISHKPHATGSKPQKQRLAKTIRETSNPLFGPVRPEDLVALNSDSNPDEVVFQPASFGFGDPEVARHVERVQVLMRSFRNSQLVGNESELAFERKMARDLLSQNVFLRRNSDVAGDVGTAELLNTVEPILLDIANLERRPSRTDVSSIKDRIEKENIVAALQVR